MVHSAVPPQALIVHSPVDLSFLGAPVSGLSVSAHAGSVAMASGANGTGSVYLLSSESASPVSIGSWKDPGALAFSSDGSMLFVFDRATGTIVAMRAASGAIAGTLDASSATGLSALAVSSGDALLYGAAQRSLWTWDLNKWQVSSNQPLDITAAAIELVPGSASDSSPALYLLDYSRTAGSPLWLLDGQAAQVYFVPSGSGAANATN